MRLTVTQTKKTGTSQNESCLRVRTKHSTLYILGDTPPGDPLDCVAAAVPYLEKAFAGVHRVGPGQAMSDRAIRRAYEPGVDLLLYDFTAHNDYGWALGALEETPAAVLLASHSPIAPGGAMADLRSAQRYATDGFRLPSAATPGILDGVPGAPFGWTLHRPALLISPVNTGRGADIVVTVAQGAIEAAYATLIAFTAQDRSKLPKTLDVVATTRRDSNDLADILTAFDLQGVRVRYLRERADIVAIVSGAGGLIDISSAAMPGQSDAIFAARCNGLPMLALTSRDTVTDAVVEFLATPQMADASAAAAFRKERSIETFATGLLAFIGAGHRRAALAAEAA